MSALLGFKNRVIGYTVRGPLPLAPAGFDGAIGIGEFGGSC